MRASTIAKLAWYKPRSEAIAGLYSCDTVSGISAQQASDIMHYAECHKNLQFGWDFAEAMYHSDIVFPAILHGDDLYVWRAYNYLHGNEDSVIAAAASFRAEGNRNLKNQIHALLMTQGMSYRFIAKKLGIHLPALIAYEKLFFNVMDRKEDHSFIAEVAYPEGRLVEAMEDYIENTGIGDLMLRAGYTHGAKHVLYAAGLSHNPYNFSDPLEGATKLDNIFMADGCLYAGLGWLHQRKNNLPIANARLSMQAGKMGKGEQESMGTSMSFGDSIIAELQEVSRFKATASSRRELIEFNPSTPSNTISGN